LREAAVSRWARPTASLHREPAGAPSASHLIVDLRLDVAQVSRILGHASVTTTLNIYTHLFDGTRHGTEIRTRMASRPFAPPTASSPKTSSRSPTDEAAEPRDPGAPSNEHALDRNLTTPAAALGASVHARRNGPFQGLRWS